MSMFSKWYQDTALEEFTKIPANKLNSTNLGEVMNSVKKLVPEGIVDVCIQIFNEIKHLETGSSALLYDSHSRGQINIAIIFIDSDSKKILCILYFKSGG